MSASALICLAPGSEETEAVTTIDLLVRGGVKVATASVASDGSLTIVLPRQPATGGNRPPVSSLWAHCGRHLRRPGDRAGTP